MQVGRARLQHEVQCGREVGAVGARRRGPTLQRAVEAASDGGDDGRAHGVAQLVVRAPGVVTSVQRERLREPLRAKQGGRNGKQPNRPMARAWSPSTRPRELQKECECGRRVDDAAREAAAPRTMILAASRGDQKRGCRELSAGMPPGGGTNSEYM